MRCFVPSLALIAATLTLSLSAQSKVVQTATSVSGCPPSATLDELIQAVDDAVSGPANKDRACLRGVLLQQARLSPMTKMQDGSFVPHLMTVDEWINMVAKRGSAEFYEVQVKVKSETYGHFAHLWSTYEIRAMQDGKATVTGINSIQAVFDGVRWRALSILWESDTTAGPVPEKYLP
jgi:hypothetical protein